MNRLIALLLIFCLFPALICCSGKRQVSDYSDGELFSRAAAYDAGKLCVRADTETSTDTFLAYNEDTSTASSVTSMRLVTDRTDGDKLRYAAETSQNGYQLMVSYVNGTVYHTGDLGYYFSHIDGMQAERLLNSMKSKISYMILSDFKSCERILDGDCVKLVCTGFSDANLYLYTDEYADMTEECSDVEYKMENYTLTLWFDSDARVCEQNLEYTLSVTMKYEGNTIRIKPTVIENTVYTYFEAGQYNITAPDDLSYYTEVDFEEMYPDLKGNP